MKRVRRILVVGARGVSALLCVAVVLLWVRGMGTADVLSYARTEQSGGQYCRADINLLSGPGFLIAGRSRQIPVDDEGADWLRGIDMKSGLGWRFGGGVDSYDPTFSLFIGGFGRIGVSSGTERMKGARTYRTWREVEAPHWLTLLVLSVPLQFWAVRGLRRRRGRLRYSRGRRPRCDYDLCATTGRCPECGREPEVLE